LRGGIICLRNSLIGFRGSRMGLRGYDHRVVDDHLVAVGSTQGEIPAGRVRRRPAPGHCDCGTVACQLIPLESWHQHLRYLEKNARHWRVKCKDMRPNNTHTYTHTHTHTHTHTLNIFVSHKHSYMNLTYTQAVPRHIECCARVYHKPPVRTYTQAEVELPYTGPKYSRTPFSSCHKGWAKY
jgi:hypothetical protein